MKKTIEKNTLTIKDFCTNHNDKMENMISLSTSPLLNTFCQKHRTIKNGICAHCYSCRMCSMFKQLREKLERNYKLLHDHIIPVADMPVINASIARLEAFGDIDSITQVKNYFNLCKHNQNTIFAIWTKNPGIIKEALKDTEKPKNLIIIYSALIMNPEHPEKILENIKENMPFIDKIFSVYDKQHASGIKINCGKLHCNNCRRCYKKNTTKIINELLK